MSIDPKKIKKTKELIDNEIKKIIDSKVLDIKEMKGKILSGLGMSEEEYDLADAIPMIEKIVEEKYNKMSPVLEDIKKNLLPSLEKIKNTLDEELPVDYKNIKNKPDIESLKYDDSRVVFDIEKIRKSLDLLLKRIDNAFVELRFKDKSVLDKTEKLVKEIKGQRKEIKRIEMESKEIYHKDLKGIGVNDHHDKEHTLESHTESELLNQLYELVSGKEIDKLHKHKGGGQPQRNYGLYNPVHFHNDVYYTKEEVVSLIAAGGGGVETDPIVGAINGIVKADGAGNISAATDGVDYISAEADPVFSASAAAGIAAGDITNWDTAHGWGDHSLAGYLTTIAGLAPDTATTAVAQPNITSLGTLTTLQVDNININGNTISSTAGTDLLITPLAGQQLILDGTIIIDAGEITGITSLGLTGTRVTAGFFTDLTVTNAITGSITGNAATVNNFTPDGGTLILFGADELIMSTTGDTDITLPTGGTLATRAGTEELDNKTLDSSVGKGTWTASGTWTLPAITLGGDVTFSENVGIVLDAALSADGKYCGIVEGGTAGATLVFGDLCYLNNDDSRWELVDANLSDGYDKKLGMCVLAAAGDGSATTMLLYGKIRADGVFPALTIGAPAYISETAGDIVVAQPTTEDAAIRIIGFANTADELFFCPSPDYITYTV